MRLLILLLGLLELYLVDLDAVLRVFEGRVNCESVRRVDIFALWVFSERTEFGAGEGLQRSLYFWFGCGWASQLAGNDKALC